MLSAGYRAWFQRLLLCLQKRLHWQGKLRGVMEHLWTNTISLHYYWYSDGEEVHRAVSNSSLRQLHILSFFVETKWILWKSISIWPIHIRSNMYKCHCVVKSKAFFSVCKIFYQIRVQVKGSGEVTSIVLLCRTAVDYKKPHALLSSIKTERITSMEIRNHSVYIWRDFLEHIKYGQQKLLLLSTEAAFEHTCLTITKVCCRVSSMFNILCAMTNVYMLIKA